MKKSNGIIIVLLIVILVVGILFVNSKLRGTDSSSVNDDNNTSQTEENIQDNSSRVDYTSFIGTWYNTETQNELTITDINDKELKFTWAIYRIAVIENNTISFDNGKGVFYFEGYDDSNFDSKTTEDEKFIRKATIVLTDNGADVLIEEVNKIDNKYTSLGEIDGGVYIKPGTYAHPIKK